jgi:hypothetical protein
MRVIIEWVQFLMNQGKKFLKELKATLKVALISKQAHRKTNSTNVSNVNIFAKPIKGGFTLNIS